MKLLGVCLLLVGMVSLAFVVSGLFAWATDTSAGATPASLANTIQLKMVLFVGLGLLLYGLEVSLSSPAEFEGLKASLATPIGKGIAWVVLAALAYHFVAGVKHLLMDGSDSESLVAGTRAAYITLAVSAVLIALLTIWII